MNRFSCAAAVAALGCALPLAAQSLASNTAQIRRAADSISEAHIRRWVNALADDSMLGRATPSPQIEQTARYIADEFRLMGLEPGGDSGTFFQRYPILRTALDSASFAMVLGRGAHGHWAFGREARLLGGSEPAAAVTGPVVLMYGAPADTARPFGDATVNGAVILYVTTAGQVNPRTFGPVIAKAGPAGVRGLIVVTDRAPNVFANAAAFSLRPRTELGGRRQEGGFPIVEVRDSSALGVLSAAGEDLAALRAQGQSGIRPLAGFTATVDMRRREVERQSAPNVVGVLPGSDPALRNEYVFYTGHMDHVGAVGAGRVNVGCRAAGADSICNGADDDASGTALVMALARGFSQLTPRPRRTMVFMTVSGEERGLWGSRYYSDNPIFPLANTVAAFNTDMVGRYFNNQPGWRDTIAVIGKEHSDLGALANRVVQEHPELHMQLVDDLWPNENFYFRSDHYNFARMGVPILFFFNGVHPDYHQATDSPDKIDAEKMMRIGRMIFYIGLDVGNAAGRPQWNLESRRRIVEAGGVSTP